MEIYTSGVANNMTKVGACSVVVYHNGEQLIQNDKPVEFAHRFDDTTNIKMLQMAIIGALKCCPTGDITIYTPNEWASKVEEGIARAEYAWKNGITTGNDDLWLEIGKLKIKQHGRKSVVRLSDAKDPGYKRAHKIAKELL